MGCTGFLSQSDMGSGSSSTTDQLCDLLSFWGPGAIATILGAEFLTCSILDQDRLFWVLNKSWLKSSDKEARRNSQAILHKGHREKTSSGESPTFVFRVVFIRSSQGKGLGPGVNGLVFLQSRRSKNKLGN